MTCPMGICELPLHTGTSIIPKDIARCFRHASWILDSDSLYRSILIKQLSFCRGPRNIRGNVRENFLVIKEGLLNCISLLRDRGRMEFSVLIIRYFVFVNIHTSQRGNYGVSVIIRASRSWESQSRG